MSSDTFKHAVILGGFCLGFGIVLALTHLITYDEIKLRAVEDTQTSLKQVIPPELHDNNPAADAILVKDDEGREVKVFRAKRGSQVTGVAYEIHGSGYAGDIKLILGLDVEGHILGVRALAHKETPGLGDKIEPAKTDWILRFNGLSLGNPPADKWKVKKDGGQFDQFSGATITPRGVVGAIKRGLEFFAAHKAELLGANG